MSHQIKPLSWVCFSSKHFFWFVFCCGSGSLFLIDRHQRCHDRPLLNFGYFIGLLSSWFWDFWFLHLKASWGLLTRCKSCLTFLRIIATFIIFKGHPSICWLSTKLLWDLSQAFLGNFFVWSDLCFCCRKLTKTWWQTKMFYF